MLKKITVFLIIFSLFQIVCYADFESAESSILINADTREVLYNKNGNEKLGMASTTKIMTAIVALENADTEKIITVSENAQKQEGSSIYIEKGDEIKLIDLLYGLMLNSGNDSAVAIAEGVAGDVQSFVNMMNEKAKEIGCKKTNFTNPSGLSDTEHFSTAYDLSLIMAYAMQNEKFAQITKTKEYQIKNQNTVTYLRNHNKLLWQTTECIGGKTGFTKANGRCLVSCGDKDGKKVIAVTLNDRDDWNDHKNLYDFGFEKLKKTQIVSNKEILCTKKIRGVQVNILSGDNVYAFLKNGRKRNVACKLYFYENINDEISIGSEIGYGEIYINNYKISTIPLLSGQKVKNNLFFKLIF